MSYNILVSKREKEGKKGKRREGGEEREKERKYTYKVRKSKW